MRTTKRKSKTAAKTAVPAAEVSAPVAEVKADAKVSVAPAAAPVAKGATAAVIALASHCTVKDAAALKVRLCERAGDSADVIVDVGAIERIDTSTMQLLCAFVRDRASRKQNVVWQGESQSWREALRLLGGRELFGAADGSAA
jgi:ABC-type transporter Mla MlaB component